MGCGVRGCSPAALKLEAGSDFPQPCCSSAPSKLGFRAWGGSLGLRAYGFGFRDTMAASMFLPFTLNTPIVFRLFLFQSLLV